MGGAMKYFLKKLLGWENVLYISQVCEVLWFFIVQ